MNAKKKACDQLTGLFENFVYPQSSGIIGSVGDGHPLDDWSAVTLAARSAVSEPLVTVTVPAVANK